jgi:hypothetical protein
MNQTSKHRAILFVPLLASALLSGVGIYLWWKGISYDLACFMMFFFGLATVVFGYDALTRNRTKAPQNGGLASSHLRGEKKSEQQFIMTESH